MSTEFYIQSTDSLQVEVIQVNVKICWSWGGAKEHIFGNARQTQRHSRGPKWHSECPLLKA